MQQSNDADPVLLHLRLMQTTDIHAHILPFDYLADRACGRTGLSGLARVIRKARAEVRNAVLFDTGDFLQGNPVADHFATLPAPEPAPTHPVIRVMNALDYAAGTLGNHDFNYGLPFLSRVIPKARFPLVCANAALKLGTTPCKDKTFLPPWTIVARRVTDQSGQDHDLRIGVIGLLPPQIDIWDRQHIGATLQTRDIVEAARAHLPHLRAAGADLVVVLAHSGIAPDDGSGRAENAALALAALPEVDVILCGHQHRIFPGPDFAGIVGVDHTSGTLHGKPAVMAGFWGSHLGVIDLSLQKTAAGWRITGQSSQLRPLRDPVKQAQGEDPHAGDTAIDALMQEAHVQTRAHMRRVIGCIARPVHSYFALVADDPSVQLVAAAKRCAVAAALAGLPESRLPLLSAVAPFKVGGAAGPDHYTAIAQGTLRLRDVADLYHYPNRLCAVQISGETLLDWLEHVAGQFNRISPGGQDQPLIDPLFPCYNFDVICGLRYQIDLSQPVRFGKDGHLRDPSARRIRNLTWNGQPVQPEQPFIVATNSYRVGGGSGFLVAGKMRDVALPRSRLVVDVLRDYLARNAVTDPPMQAVWRFAPLPGTSVWFDSAPAATGHLSALPDHWIEAAGTTPEGFARFRLYL